MPPDRLRCPQLRRLKRETTCFRTAKLQLSHHAESAGGAIARLRRSPYEGGFSNVLDAEIDQQLKDNKVSTDFVQLQTIQDCGRWDKAGALMHFKRRTSTRFLTP